jgi:uncharacterized protein (TIGR03083 family)
MAPLTLSFESYLDVITEELDRIEELGEAAGQRLIASCPGWRAPDLLGHLARVCSYWSTQLLAADAEHEHEDEREPLRAGDLVTCADELVRTLRALGADAPCWNWSGAAHDALFVARRLALETTMHRVDLEGAPGRRGRVDAELAVDGIDERIGVYLPAELLGSEASLGGSIGLVCEDQPHAWLVTVERGRVEWRAGRGPASAVLVAPAAELFLFTWNRLSAHELSLTGDPRVADAWAALVE